MIRLVVIFLVGALIWMIWWAFGQVAYQKALESWVAAQRANGAETRYSTLETRGFPNRFDTTISDLKISDAASGIGWSAPFVQILSLAYKPHQVIAVLPNSHEATFGRETVTFTHEDARASLFLQPSTSLGLDRARVIVERLNVRSDTGEELALDNGRLAAEAREAAVNTYRIGGELSGLVLNEASRLALDPGELMPERITRLRLDADLVFDAPLDRFAVEEGLPRVASVDLSDLSISWGEMTARATGDLTIDDLGFLSGKITLEATEWRMILDLAEGLGGVTPEARGAWENALDVLSGPDGRLEAPLSLDRGAVSLGIFPLGEIAPLAGR